MNRSHGPFVAGPTSPSMSVECPRCHAVRGDRCYRLGSWVVDEKAPAGGFYTSRCGRPHSERRPSAPDPVAEPAAGPSRAEMRKQIKSLAYAKLGGKPRMLVYSWSSSATRTDAELADKLAELEGLPGVTR